jgi:hypothetical protein
VPKEARQGSVGASGGGGIYIVSDGTVCVDALTAIFANEASPAMTMCSGRYVSCFL